jgi:2'-hydroxyisoflavone reductase
VRVLVIGGTRFVGRHIVEAAVARGDDVTLFNRGKSDPELFPDLERIAGDRDGELGRLSDRAWDAVVDTCGYVPRIVRDSAEFLTDSGLYVYISSLSVHRETAPPGATEEQWLHEPAPFGVEEITDDTYGPLKVACELEVKRVFAERSLVVRPGVVVGPFDRSDRFTYWVRRVRLGGSVLAPEPRTYGLQWIDARDLAAFVLDMAHARRGGVFGAVTPRGYCTMSALLEICLAEAEGGATFSWIPQDWLLAHGVEPWDDLPLWIPAEPGAWEFDPTRAMGAGLRCRAVEDTVRDTLAWDRARASGDPSATGITLDRERELLAAWNTGPS